MIPSSNPSESRRARENKARDQSHPPDAAIHCRLDELLRQRGMTLTELARLVDISLVNLSVLKNDRARAIRFSTLLSICQALDCQPGDLLEAVTR